MGEAWFMAPEREMFPQLLGDIATLPDDAVMQPLEEIASGSSNFGLLAEWVEWYHYLLPQLIVRRWEPTYFQPAERLFSAFMNQHPDLEDTPPYPEFYVDALHTLGRYIMSPVFWPAGKLDAVNCLSKWTGPSGVAGWVAGRQFIVRVAVFLCQIFGGERCREMVPICRRYPRPVLANPNHNMVDRRALNPDG